MGSLKFAARFYPRFTLVQGKPNTLGIAGAGALEIAEGSLTLHYRKRRPLWFSKDETRSFELAKVADVTCSGKEVAMRIGEGVHHLRVWLASPEQAQALAAALPTARSAELARQLADHEAFVGKLNALATKPIVTRALVATNIAVFALLAANGAGVMQPDSALMARWGSNFGPYTMGGDWWRLGSSMFMHFGLIHLLLNMWALWSGGHLIERLYGSRAFLAIYAGSGLAGSLASLAWNPLVNSAGASGAIFGLYGALLTFFWHERLGIPESIVKSQRASALTFLLYSLAYGFAHQGVDNAAHVGGLVTGMIMGQLLALPLDRAVREARAMTHLARATAAAVALSCIVAYRVVWPSESVRKDQKYLLDLDWISAEESAVNARYDELIARVKAGRLSDADFVKALDGEIIPRWFEVQRSIAQDKVAPDSPMADHHAFLMRYSLVQAEALQLTHDAVKQGRQDLMQRANAKFAEREQLIQEYRTKNRR